MGTCVVRSSWLVGRRRDGNGSVQKHARAGILISVAQPIANAIAQPVSGTAQPREAHPPVPLLSGPGPISANHQVPGSACSVPLASALPPTAQGQGRTALFNWTSPEQRCYCCITMPPPRLESFILAAAAAAAACRFRKPIARTYHVFLSLPEILSSPAIPLHDAIFHPTANDFPPFLLNF